MSISRILEQLRTKEGQFVSLEQIKEYSTRFHYPVTQVLNYLVSQDSMIKIFKDLYYLKTSEEKSSNKLSVSLLEIVGKALEFKDVSRWYYGLYTALKLNKMPVDDEHRNDIYIINDRVFFREPLVVENTNFKFIKFKDIFFDFGIVKGVVNYSDREKTVLDYVYLLKQNRMHERKILVEISKLQKFVSKEKITEYATHYDDQVREIVNKFYESRLSAKTSH